MRAFAKSGYHVVTSNWYSPSGHSAVLSRPCAAGLLFFHEAARAAFSFGLTPISFLLCVMVLLEHAINPSLIRQGTNYLRGACMSQPGVLLLSRTSRVLPTRSTRWSSNQADSVFTPVL